MSEETSTYTQRHAEYVKAHTRPEDEFLKQLKSAARHAKIPAIWIAWEQANLMQILLKLARANTVVEVGTLAGYSAICMARALPSTGKLITIELDPKHAEFSRAWIAKSDVAAKIDVRLGAGKTVLPTLADCSADAIFLDADKENYPEYLRHGRRIVRPGGLIMADNAFAFGELFAEAPSDPDVHDMRRFNDHMAAQANLHAVIAPIGDGLWVGVN